MKNKFEQLISMLGDTCSQQTLSEVTGASRSLAISNLFSQTDKTILVICENNHQAEAIHKEIGFFNDIGRDNLFYIPDTETLPYDQESPHSGLISERARAFHDLAMRQKSNRIVITSISNVIRNTSSISHWKEEFISINKGDGVSTDSVKQKLLDLGYNEVDLEVSNSGEFCFKNNIFDVYPVGMTGTIRIRLKDGIVTSLEKVNINTQRSEDEVDGIIALPAKEIPIDEKAIDKFRLKFRRNFGRGLGQPLYESVISGNFPSGIEYFLPLFQEETSTLFDYLPKGDKTLLVLNGDIEKAFEKSWSQINKRYEDLQSDKERKLLSPEQLWVTDDEYNIAIKEHPSIALRAEKEEGSISLSSELTHIERKQNIQGTMEQLDEWMDKAEKVIFCLHSSAREDQLHVICEMMDEELHHKNNWNDVVNSDEKLFLITSPVDEGFYLRNEGIVVITEKELFGQPIFAKNEDNLEEGANYQAIQDLKNLEVGDPVCHVKYGVGRYKGLTVMQISGIDREYLQIGYAQDASGFVPMDELDFVSRYGGMSTDKAPLDIMGSEKWLKGLNSAIGDIEVTAQALLRIQAERQVQEGTVFKKPTFKFQKFCREFPFQETRDQKTAISDIITDMTSSRPMDRTVVGDVGFGKTEVAMRAAFLAAESGFQVAIMVPTTLLAQQHYENFKTRFSSFNFNIKCLSRFDKKTEKSVLKEMKEGTVDIVIGTHRLIQKDIEFNNLGLLVIDEEHRFGVKHKEKLRGMRSNLDVLSMTATPIPRTLSMSLHGIKDLSIIATPPAKRLSIRTIVGRQDNAIVSEAIQREKMRDGQVFVLHNTIESIYDRAKEIEELVPGIRVGVGHGRMKEAELESTMASFYKHEFDVLVCTTIIETGIDVPNANSIIMDSADRLGLAQLHQLRGRVGRSHHQAYAYLLTNTESETAHKRLEAMEKATNLGEGFVLANHDLEIRGAGELLGEDQSGHIQNIGFALYMRLLERAIDIIQNGGDIQDLFETSDNMKLDISISGLIDTRYIENQQARLSMYKRFASVTEIQELISTQDELDDRFGELPENTINLIDISKLRCYLKQIGVKKLLANAEGGIIQLGHSISISNEKLLELIENDPEHYELNGPGCIRFKQNTKDRDERFEYLISLITELAA